MKKFLSLLFAGLVIGLSMATGASAMTVGLFPTILSGNTTGYADSYFTGPPDDSFIGIGGQVVTYDFGADRVTDGVGQDFNVYEVDWGSPEFSSMSVSVSIDGTMFINVDATIKPVVRIFDDSKHGNDSYAKSYDLSGSGLSEVRYIRIDGDGTGAAGGTSGFDLDAIGAINYKVATPVPIPAAVWLFGSGLVGLAGIRRKFKKQLNK
jgi:hypothetical protein